jgi:hypothetical protein
MEKFSARRPLHLLGLAAGRTLVLYRPVGFLQLPDGSTRTPSICQRTVGELEQALA